jgi:hypothetical protein
MRDQHQIGGREVPAEIPRIDVQDELLILPAKAGLLVPGEVLEH